MWGPRWARHVAGMEEAKHIVFRQEVSWETPTWKTENEMVG
jgi:hypothetical protein